MAAKNPVPGVSETQLKVPESAKVRDIVEYRAGLDQTLPPTPLKELMAAGGANVFVLSVDAEVRDTVQRAGGEQYPVYAVDDWAELVTAIDSGQCGIAVLDAALLGRSLARRIAELERYNGRLVTLVAADRNDAQELIGFLSDRKIHRLLIKPPALGITRLLLESAVSRCIQLRDHGHDPDETRIDVRPRAPLARPVTKPVAAGGPKLPAWLLATALVSLLLGVAVLAGLTSLWQPRAGTDKQAADPVVTAPAAATVQPAGDRFADLLARAERAFMEGRLAEPVGDNALDYYLTILAAEPAHALARQRLTLVLDALFAQAEEALLGNSLDSAAGVLASVRRADPQSGRLAFLDAQLQRARAAASAAAAAAATARDTERQVAATVPLRGAQPTTAAPAPRGAQQAELDSLLTIAAARLQRGQLLEPAGDSAREYIARAGLLNPDDPAVVRARADLAAALVTAAGVVLDAGNVDAADGLLVEARNLGASSQAVALVDAELRDTRAVQQEQRRGALLADARQRLQSGALVEPAGSAALDALLALEAEAPGFGDSAALWADLSQRLAANANAALGRSDWATAETWVAALARSGRDPPGAAALTRQIEVGRLRQQYLSVAAPASALTLLVSPPPAYPRDAQLEGLEGSVELEFVVGLNGRPRDIVTVRAEPPGRFDRAATAAVSQYQYRPFVRDGETYERRIRLTIRFALQ